MDTFLFYLTEGLFYVLGGWTEGVSVFNNKQSTNIEFDWSVYTMRHVRLLLGMMALLSKWRAL